LFIQLYHQGWDNHDSLQRAIVPQCKATDQASAALITDLKRRGLLDDTIVIWGGEFGRTVYSQGKLTADNYGRDHHPKSFTTWVAGGGFKPGVSYGKTDDYGYNIERDPVHIHDFHATLLHLLGIHHEKLIYQYQGRKYRLTDVSGKLIDGIIS
jgi:arylsulfatase A-like enzyme